MKQLIFFLLFSIVTFGQTVFKTPSGEKYHTTDCRMVKNKSEALSIADAVSIGLTPCKICNPGVIQSFKASKKAVGEKETTTQCLGRTKKGTRCKHMTSIKNGYCYQHQPND